MNFYSVIIGTELLNGRRTDAHFEFLNKELLKRGWEQKASFVIKDDPKFMEDVFTLIKNDPKSVMFSFGGIGATPDDYTREVAAKVFRDGKTEQNQIAKQMIIDKFKEEAYPNRINMATLPTDVVLLKNIVSNVPGFGIDERFFFTPGFPSMSRAMVVEALDRFYPQSDKQKTRYTLKAKCSEDILVATMKKIPSGIDFSSLPQIDGEKRTTVISVASYDKEEAKKYFDIFVEFLDSKNINYTLEDD